MRRRQSKPAKHAHRRLEPRLSAFKRRLHKWDDDIRARAARRISRLGRAVFPAAVEWTRDPSWRVRSWACNILGQLGWRQPGPKWSWNLYHDGVSTLLNCLRRDRDSEVRATAAAALGFLADRRAVRPLARASQDRSDLVRYYVAHALGSYYENVWAEINSKRLRNLAQETLLRLMDDNDPETRDWATFGLHQGSHDTPEIRARFWRALDDPDCNVRGEAAEGLAKFGDRSLIPRLEQLLLEDDEISPCYFLAAEELGDPCLLPAVRQAAADMVWGECGTSHPYAESAIEVLTAASPQP